MRPKLALGIDFGTSGARAIAINQANEVMAQAIVRFKPSQKHTASLWQSALFELIEKIAPSIRQQVGRIAINGTSATMLLCDRHGQPLSEVLMYNDLSARSAINEVRALAPPESSAVLSATSTLTKAIWLYRSGLPEMTQPHSPNLYIAHQADWLASRLHEQPPVSDYHNALKLGYDAEMLAYPDWLLASPIADWLPEVLAPGAAIAPVSHRLIKKFSFAPACQVCAGTTDSNAAFLASEASRAGEAVTSLGSTLVLKLLSSDPIANRAAGIYSHRLGNLWLVGGASNTGGAVLGRFFSPDQISDLSAQIDPSAPCQLNYYPLNAPGERFPINDPDYPPRLTPRPDGDRDFLHELLDGMAKIEAKGYQTLESLGAPMLEKIYTAGGGANNEAWRAIRQQKLGVEIVAARQTEAAYGTAQLAMDGLSRFL